MVSECPMHTNYSARPDYVVMCCTHLGSRYVILVRHSDGSFEVATFWQGAPEWIWAGPPSQWDQADQTYDERVECMRAMGDD
jgi:hypothetical protein